jgi:hypothetical protein
MAGDDENGGIGAILLKVGLAIVSFLIVLVLLKRLIGSS